MIQAWIIASDENTETYLIPHEKAIWFTEQMKGSDIQQMIANKELGNIKTIRYDELKQLIFIDTDFTVFLQFKDDKKDDIEIPLEKTKYPEVRNYFKAKLKGAELVDYSIFRQVLPNLISLGVSIALAIATYLVAIGIENGEEARIRGNRAWLKKIIAVIAEFLGPSGSMVAGIVIVSAALFFLIKKLQDPKKGQVLKIKNRPQLALE